MPVFRLTLNQSEFVEVNKMLIMVELLECINELRTELGMPEVIWDEIVARVRTRKEHASGDVE